MARSLGLFARVGAICLLGATSARAAGFGPDTATPTVPADSGGSVVLAPGNNGSSTYTTANPGEGGGHPEIAAGPHLLLAQLALGAAAVGLQLPDAAGQLGNLGVELGQAAAVFQGGPALEAGPIGLAGGRRRGVFLRLAAVRVLRRVGRRAGRRRLGSGPAGRPAGTGARR